MKHLRWMVFIFPTFLFSVFASDGDEGLLSLLKKSLHRGGKRTVFREQLKSTHSCKPDLNDTKSVHLPQSQSSLEAVDFARNGSFAGTTKGTGEQSEIPLAEVAELQESVAEAQYTVVSDLVQNASNQTAFHPTAEWSASISNATTIVHSEVDTTSSAHNASAMVDLTVKPTASSCNARATVDNASEIATTAERAIHPSTKKPASISVVDASASPYNASALADLAVKANAKPMVDSASKLPFAAERAESTESSELGMPLSHDVELTTVEHGRSRSDNSFSRESSPLQFYLYLFGGISAALVIASLIIIWWRNPISLSLRFHQKEPEMSSVVFIDRSSLERCDPERQLAVNMDADLLYPFSTADRLKHPDFTFGAD